MDTNSPAHYSLSSDLHEKCAVFGVYGKNLDVSRLTYFGLYALQHRGQESSGISVSNGKRIVTHKDNGLVAQVYTETELERLSGHIAIGHNRYATSVGGECSHVQPVVRDGYFLALAHNGNLPSTTTLESFLHDKGVDTSTCNDSELMYESLRYFLSRGSSIEDAVKESFPYFTGVFSLLLMTRDKLIAVRDACGVRPLSLGKVHGGYVVASETCAFDTVNAEFVRDVEPGEMVVIDDDGVHSYTLAKAQQKLDIFEFVYFARPDSMLMGKRVNEVRRELGRQLARECEVKADVVIGVPDSALPAALGYSEESGIPFDFGFIKNRYIHRTFISPTQKLRERGVEMKLNPLPEVLKNKSVVVIDDSIVRSTTSMRLVKRLRDAGAREVHMLVSSPPVKYPDFYGINTPYQKDLIAATKRVDEIQKIIGADSLYYLSYDGMVSATGLPENVFCTSCFTGIYPVDIGERVKEIICPI